MKFTKKYLEHIYNDILKHQKQEKFDDYFTKDCYIEINGKTFTSDQFKQRMQWIKDQQYQSIDIKVLNCFTSEDQQWVSDRHITSTVDKNGLSAKVLVMQQSQLEDSRIKAFYDVTFVLEGNESTKHSINAS